MNYQSTDWPRGGRAARGDMIRDAPILPPKDSFAFDLKEALDLAPPSTPSSVAASTISASSGNRYLDGGPPSLSNRAYHHSHEQAYLTPPPPPPPPPPPQSQPSPAHLNRGQSHRGFNMASTNKAQSQCLHLCSAVASTCDQVAEKMSEYIGLVKHLPHGFGPLANDVLGTCQVLFFIEAGLGDAARQQQSLPLDMITVLEKKFRAAQADFRSLDHVVTKQLDYERAGAMGRMRRGFGKMFGDNSLERMMHRLAKTREDIKISALMFQWKLGAERMESELGIGYIGLAAALEGTEYRLQRAASTTSEDKMSNYRSPVSKEPAHHRSVENHHMAMSEHSQPPSLPPLPRSDRSIGHGHDSLASAESQGYGLGSEYSHLSPYTRYTASSNGSTHSHEGQYGKRIAPDRLSTFDEAAEQSSALDETVADVKALELDGAKAFRIESDPYNMPRQRPRSTVDTDRSNVNQILASAVRAGDHKLVAQLLDRGVAPDTGLEAHALNEAIMNLDAESVRLLLLYGADANATDREGLSPLAAAAEKSFLDGAIALLKYGANPNMPLGPDIDPPLYTAAANNNVRLSHVLLAYGAHANATTSSRNTVMVGAINKKAPKNLIDMLLNYGAGPNEKNGEGKTAMFEAITSARVDIVNSLIEHGANTNLPGPKHLLWPATYQSPCLQALLDNGADCKKTPGIMELATSINNIESIRILLKAGVDPNAKKDGVYTPLCSSIRDNRKDIFDLLLRNGADPNVPASEYPCFKCVTHHREQYLPALVAAGGNLHAPKGILETAVVSKNGPALKWLLDQGIDPNDKTPKGHTALTSAIRDNHIGFVDTLLARGANPNIRGQDWPVCMAVHNPEILARILAVLPEPRAFKGVMEMAVVANQLESVKLLLNAGVSVEDRNGGVFSPLTSALREHRKEIVVFLINDGRADVNAPGEHLPIVKALRRLAPEDPEYLVDALLDKGADPNKVYRGWNGIMQAIENGDIDMLKKLVQKSGVDMDVKDELGRTVTEIAISRRWEEAVDVLLTHARN
ncbi:hypothetical protein E4U25_002656 [Claviceps purpurea]|nr:hypothetical protein E4U11_003189 [Claviceps purpurea]KAG6237502.1 hypothetical protein E4U25_002656 [Claviceps purpurea]KAG6254763.1 hypothetical protein E4U23_005614 [Claviceps purpurea]KAG6265608.1 hypothetical protein E4U49_000851 [Claviceps purpurea]KAG6306390.1 hypothetical protein E4U45_007204 [Claviceps purpurea]